MSDDDLIFTAEELAGIASLEERRIAKFQEILACLAPVFGYGDVSALTDAQREQLEEEAEEACERWHVDAEMDLDRDVLAEKTPLQRLLAEHFDLGEMILNIEDEAASHQKERWLRRYIEAQAAAAERTTEAIKGLPELATLKAESEQQLFAAIAKVGEFGAKIRAAKSSEIVTELMRQTAEAQDKVDQLWAALSAINKEIAGARLAKRKGDGGLGAG